MPKSKLYKSLSPDDASSLDDAVAEDPALPPGSAAAPARMKSGSYTRTDYSPGHSEERNASVAAGRLPEEVYANTLPWWRAALRRKCVAVVEWESEVIGEWQVRPFLSLSLFPRLAGRGGEGAGSSHFSFRRLACGRPGWTHILCRPRCWAPTRSSSCSCPHFSSLGTTIWEEGKSTGFRFTVAHWLGHSNIFCRLGFAMRSLLDCIYRRF